MEDAEQLKQVIAYKDALLVQIEQQRNGFLNDLCVARMQIERLSSMLQAVQSEVARLTSITSVEA